MKQAAPDTKGPEFEPLPIAPEVDVDRIIQTTPMRLSKADWDEVHRMLMVAWSDGFKVGLDREHIIHGGRPANR